MGFDLTELEKLEALHADAMPEAIDGVYYAFPALAKALREAWEKRDAAVQDSRDALGILERVAEQLNVSAEALAEDPSVVVRLRTEKDAEIARLTYELEQGRKGQDDFGCCGGSDETPPEHTQDCSIHPGNCYACKTQKSVGTVAHAGAYETRCSECLVRERDAAIRERDEALSLKQHWAADADAKEALLQAVARACRDTEPPTQEVLSVLGNVLRHRDEAREENKRLKALLQEMCGYITPTQDQFAPILNRANLALRSVPTLGATYEVL